MKKTVAIPVIIAALILIVFLASCISFVKNDNGIMLSGYVLRDGEDYYLLYAKGNTELTVGSKKNHTVKFGTYCEADTGEVDAFLDVVATAREECRKVYPEYEGYEVIDGKNNATVYSMPQNEKIHEFMNLNTNFADSAFAGYNESKKDYSDGSGFIVSACEVPGTDGKVLYLPSEDCVNVLFYVLASDVNSDLKSMEWSEFYQKCNDKINPPKIRFKLPWRK